MKKFIVITVLISFVSTTWGQKFLQKNSLTAVAKTYNAQKKEFFGMIFETTKTGPKIQEDFKIQLEEEIYNAFMADFENWKKFTQKTKGEKGFSIKCKSAKYSAEAKEYETQFKNFMKYWTENRLAWDETTLAAALSKDAMKKFTEPVIKKFEERSKKMLQKIGKK